MLGRTGFRKWNCRGTGKVTGFSVAKNVRDGTYGTDPTLRFMTKYSNAQIFLPKQRVLHLIGSEQAC